MQLPPGVAQPYPQDNGSSPPLGIGGDPNQDPSEQGDSPDYPALDNADYAIDLSEQDRNKLGRRVCESVREWLEATQLRRENLKEWRRAYEVTRTGRGGRRWDGSADIPSLYTRIYCQAASTRLNQQIVQAKPPMSAVARKQEAIDATSYIEDSMEYVLEQAEWEQRADESHTELPIAGNVFIQVWFDEEWMRVPIEQVELDENAFQAQMMAGAHGVDAAFDSLKTTRGGKVKNSVAFEDRLKYRGVRLRMIPWQDGIICPATVRDSTKAYGIGEQVTLSGADLQDGVRAGKYLAEAVEQLLRCPSDDPAMQDATGYSDRWERLEEQGIIGTGTGQFDGDNDEDAPYRQYQCVEMCWKGDWDGDGQQEWAWLTVHYPTALVLRIQYLPYEHGEPCYLMIPFFPRPGELLGMGMAEMIACYQDVGSDVFCQLIDHNDLALNSNGNYFYDKAKFNPDKVEIAMGQPTGVEGKPSDAVMQIPFTPLPSETFEVGRVIKEMLDLATASSNPSLGQTTDAKHTLGEVQIVTAAGNMMFEELASRVARQWARVWHQIRWLVAQYGDGSGGRTITYRKAATPGRSITVQDATGNSQEVPVATIGGQQVPAPNGFAFKTIPSSYLRADVDLVPTGLQIMSDMQSRLGQAQAVMNELKQNPLTMQIPEALQVALDQYLQAFRYPQREKIMALVEQGIQAQQAAAQQQATMEAAMSQAMAPAADQAVQFAFSKMLDQMAAAQMGGGAGHNLQPPPHSGPLPAAGAQGAPPGTSSPAAPPGMG